VKYGSNTVERMGNVCPVCGGTPLEIYWPGREGAEVWHIGCARCGWKPQQVAPADPHTVAKEKVARVRRSRIRQDPKENELSGCLLGMGLLGGISIALAHWALPGASGMYTAIIAAGAVTCLALWPIARILEEIRERIR
jgi:hypothetical protein